MTDCAEIVFKINPAQLSYNPSLTTGLPFPDFVQDLLRYFAPFPALPGNVELPPITPPAATGSPMDIMAALFDKMPPLLGALAPIFVIMNLLKCILDVICAIPKPWDIIKAVRVLLLDCLPPFIAMFPPFYMAYLTLVIIRMVLALTLLILENIISLIKFLIDVYNKIVDFIKKLKEVDIETVIQYLIKLACDVVNSFIKAFGVLNILQPIFDFIAPFLGLSSSSAWSFLFCKKRRGSGEPCPPDDEMARYLENPNDPSGFSFDPATVPVSCYPDLQTQIRLLEARFDKTIITMPELPSIDSLYNALRNDLKQIEAGTDPDDFLDRLGKFIGTYGDSGEPFASTINTFNENMKCTLYAAACNALDRFSTTFEANKTLAQANGTDYIIVTITPKTVGGEDIGPIGYGPIESNYEPIISTDLGEVYDIQEQSDGTFTAKIKSSEAGLATVCAALNCYICNEDHDDGYGADNSTQVMATMKTIDGRIIRRSISTVISIDEFVPSAVQLSSLVEVPDPDGYGASTFEESLEDRCLALRFEAPVQVIAPRQGACE